jgi:ACS family allantoate permease-like MFS transporter
MQFQLGVASRFPSAVLPWLAQSLVSSFLVLLTSILGTPDEVRWLTLEEKRMTKSCLIENQFGDETTSRNWNWEQCRECFRDPQMYFVFLNTFLACIPKGGITTFSSLLYVTFGFDSWGSMLYGLPRNAMYVVIFILVAFCLRKF